MTPLEQRFVDFHSSNPRVYDLFRRFALEAFAAGRQKMGAKAIAERIRWFTAVETRGDDFKINNSFVSRYARLLIQNEPHLAPLFERRALKA